jgi:hypothetical protein
MRTESIPTMKKIGELLLESGAISEGQLEFGLQYQERETHHDRGSKLGEILMKHDCVDRVSLKIALKRQWQLQSAHVEQVQTIRQYTYKDHQIKEIIPPWAMVKFLVFPLIFRETALTKKLIVLAEKREDEYRFEELSFFTGCNISPITTDRAQLFELIERYFFEKD